MRVCPECGSMNTITNRSQTFCKLCGTVLDEGSYSGTRVV